MMTGRSKSAHDLYRKIKWLIFFRALFAGVLLGSALIAIIQPGTNLALLGLPLVYLLAMAVGLLLFSVVCAVVLPRIKRLVAFAYFQTALDTLFVTFIIFVTGAFSSFFLFLYLVVIIYTTMVIYRRGGMFIATLCILQFGILTGLEYFNLIQPSGFEPSALMIHYDWQYVVYRLLITAGAFYAVAFLSGYLSEQERSAKKELWAMEDQMKRVERLAAVGEMAAGLTHEIKNPLASLSGSIQMLKESVPYDPAHDKLMQIALREADRLSALVTEFLMFARPRPGKVQQVRLDWALEETVSLFRADPKYNDSISVRTELNQPLTVEIDPEQLRQVIWNLLNNAAESISGPEGRINIALYPLKRRYVCISIEDNGCGIPDEIINSIFDPFFSTKPKGTGLGLSIVQRIIGSYGGLIDIQTTPGKGTRVTVKLRRYPHV